MLLISTDMFQLIILATTLSLCSPLVPLPRTNILHPTSGLVFKYLAQYAPADNVISFTVAIPLTLDMCYLLPLHTLHKIPQCGYDPSGSTTNQTTRQKRLVTELISIGIGTAALSLATLDHIHMAQIQEDVKTITKALPKLDSLSTELFHLQAGELKLAMTLNHTQNALNRTINIMNHHGIAIEHLGIFARYLDNRLSTFIHSVESHFLHTSISNILANRLNLHFIHHRDLNRVAHYVTTASNVNFTTETTGPPLIDLISRLLIQQTIHFLPQTASNNNNDSILGTLSISSFLADTKRRHTPFSVYQLIPVPFHYYGNRVRLADLPAAIGIDFDNLQLVKWTESEFSACDFNYMSVCRETPPTVTKWTDSCLFQILNDSTLSACRTEPFKDAIFYRRLGSQWIISTKNTQRCNLATLPSVDVPQIIRNTGRTLSPVTLMTIPPKTTLLCDHFNIPSPPETSEAPLTLWDFSLTNNSYGDNLNLLPFLYNHTRWPKLPFISNELQEVINFIAQKTSTPRPISMLKDFHRHPIGIFNMAALTIIVITLVIIMGLCIYLRRIRLPTVYVSVPNTAK